MKKQHEKFAMRIKTFSFVVLSFLMLGITSAIFGMETSQLIDNLGAALTFGGGIGALATVPWMVMLDGAKTLTFKELSQEEVSKLSEEEQGKYLADLIRFQQKSIKELEAKSAKDDESRKEIEKQLNSLKEANITAMKSNIETMGTQMAKLMKEVDSKTKGQPVTFKHALLKELESKKDDIKTLLETKSGTIKLDVEFDMNTKASQSAADITNGTDFAMMESGVGQIATRRPFIRQLFENRTTDKEYVKYNDQETVVRDTKNVANCTASTHTSKLTWRVRDLKMEKVRDMVDVCIDMMDDYSFVEGEIRALVNTDVALKVDEQLLLGTGVSPELNSIDAVSSTFAAGSYATSIQDAQLLDLIYVGGALVADAGLNNKFMANVALLNPSDATKMKLLKDADGNYLMPNWVSQRGLDIGGIQVIANPLVPAGQCYIMDTSKGVVYSRKGITITFSFENKDNVEKELVTVVAYERLNFRVRNVDANAFLHIPDIAAAITAITAP